MKIAAAFLHRRAKVLAYNHDMFAAIRHLAFNAYRAASRMPF
jgi:hypothetical protein